MSNRPRLQEATLLVVGGVNDAPGIRIVVGADGKIIIEKVPGWEPFQMRELAAAMTVVAEATQLSKHQEVQHTIISSATTFALSELQRYMVQALPQATTAAPLTVVVVTR